jgi:hypothetical protein
MPRHIGNIRLPFKDELVIGRDLDPMARIVDELQGITDPIKQQSDIWIDPVNGIDGSADGTAEKPFKTFAAMQANVLPKITLETTRVWIREGELRENIFLSGYNIVGGDLVFLGLANVDPFPTSPIPWGLLFTGMRAPTISQGPISGVATGGTRKSIQLSTANWIPGELKNKFFVINSGTNIFSWGRILDNTATEFEVSGYYVSPFDNTSEFYLAEEAVTVRPPDGGSGTALSMFDIGGGGQIGFEGIKFQMQTGYNFVSNVARFQVNTAYIQFRYCSFIGDLYPVTTGPLSSQVLISLNNNQGVFDAESCAFSVPDLPPGKFSGVMWPFGPNGPMEFRDCVANDNFQFYYGQTGLYFQNCSIRYRPNMLEMNVSRAVNWFRMYQCYIDANNVTNIWRFDGPQGLDCRDSLLEGAPGDGLVTLRGHQGEGNHMYLARTEVSGCGGDAIRVSGNSLASIWNCTTDGSKVNGGWGVRAENGSIIRFNGTNTIRGTKGDMNLGDNTTNVAHGVTATDTTHLTRCSQV